MDKDKIKALEPKYTGNTRPLTEGEAYEIMQDARMYDNGVMDDLDPDLLENIPPVIYPNNTVT